MKQLYLHVGQAKTGTAAIQRYCYNNQFSSRRAGLVYSEVGREGYKIRTYLKIVLAE
jgi:hypothetical protein